MNSPILARPRLWTGAALLSLVVLVLGACAGTGGVAGTASAGPPASAGSTVTAACIDAETTAIIQALRDDPGDAQSILDEQGDELIAGLRRFTPPVEATTWRDELVAAVEGGDAAAVQGLVQAIGSQVILEFC
jgi:hypothetical protein